MKTALIILFLIVSVAVNATTYYIDPSGSDSNNGSSSSPWKTLAYACSKATASGDIIHVNTGTFIETKEIVLAAGVSLIGAGISNTIIKSHYQYTRNGENYSAASIYAQSGQGSNGNQEISGFTLDGDWAAGKGTTGCVGIVVRGRSNVILHDCVIKDFYVNGVTFSGFNDYSNPSSSYATGNRAYNLTVTNCGDQPTSSQGGGGFVFGGQDGMWVYNSTFSNTNVYRFDYPYGHVSDNVGTKNIKNCKFYGNKSYKPDYAGVTEGGSQVWNFHMECWNTDGGFEVYNNEFYDGDCAIDVGGAWSRKGSSAYSWYIHNNLFTGTPVQTGQGKQSICVEGPDVNDVWINYNHFLNLPTPVVITNGWGSPSVANNISFNYNIVESAGWHNTGGYGEIIIVRCSGGDAVQNLYLNNNVIQSSTGDHNTGIHIYGAGTVSNVNIKNNIIVNNDNNGFLRIDNNGSWNGFYVNNNIFYNNSLTTPLFTASTPSNYTFLNNSLSNPSFVSSTDFHLQSGSQAIGKGVSVAGLTTDYAGNTVNNPPSIGAYESGSTAQTPPPVVPVYQSSSVENTTPSTIDIIYNLSLNNLIVPNASSFSVIVNSTQKTVSSVAVSGAKVKLTLANRIVAGDVIAVSYTKPAANPIQTTTSNGIAASISNQQVINNCINTAPTAIIISPLTNSSFSASASITISASAIDTDGSVTLVEFYNGITKLGSKSSAPYTFTWNNVTAGNYSLSVTATDNLNAKTSSSSISISVANAAPKTNQHPIVKILNPSKGIKLEKLSPVTIDAIASDPDGTVSKVEFYNGSVKLVELISAPYTYTWKDVLAGNYSIIAIATDNLNDTTVSSPVEFEIGSTVKYDVNSERVKLYPNPNNGHFSVEFLNPLQNDKSEIIITDLAGKLVYNEPVLKEDKLKQIDVSGSRSGIYVMMIKEKEILLTKKFIKN